VLVAAPSMMAAGLSRFANLLMSVEDADLEADVTLGGRLLLGPPGVAPSPFTASYSYANMNIARRRKLPLLKPRVPAARGVGSNALRRATVGRVVGALRSREAVDGI
jgi:hypothetical protein